MLQPLCRSSRTLSFRSHPSTQTHLLIWSLYFHSSFDFTPVLPLFFWSHPCTSTHLLIRSLYSFLPLILSRYSLSPFYHISVLPLTFWSDPCTSTHLFIWSLYSLSSHSHSQVWLLNLPRQEWEERCLHWIHQREMKCLYRFFTSERDMVQMEHWKALYMYNCGESIFEYEYFLAYEAKIEKSMWGVGGPWIVSESMLNTENPVRWTVPLLQYLLALVDCISS